MEAELPLSGPALSATRSKTSGWGPLIKRTVPTSNLDTVLCGDTRDRAPRCGRTSNETAKSRHSTRLGAHAKIALGIGIGPSLIAKTLSQNRSETGSPLPFSRPRRGSWSKVMLAGSTASGEKKASLSRIASITTSAAAITRTGSQSSRRGSLLETFTRAPAIKSIKSSRRGSIVETASITSNHRGSILETTCIKSTRRGSSIPEASASTTKRRGSMCETTSHAPSTTNEASAWPMITRSASAAMAIDFQELGLSSDTLSTL